MRLTASVARDHGRLLPPATALEFTSVPTPPITWPRAWSDGGKSMSPAIQIISKPRCIVLCCARAGHPALNQLRRNFKGNIVHRKTLLLAAVVMLPCPALAHEGHKESDFVSESSRIVGTYSPAVSSHSAASMADAGQAFVASLDAAQRKTVLEDLKSAERQKWTNLPQRSGNGGLALGKCSEPQMKAFCDLMATLLSKEGYAKICHVMLADDQLLEGGNPRPGFGTEDFFVVLFGEPSASEPWGFQLDGHHLGLNLSIHGDKITLAPSHTGTQPAKFKIGDKEIRPLAAENDIAFELVGSLSLDQQQSAILADSKGNLAAGPGHDEIPKLNGVTCDSFTASQLKLLEQLIVQWVGILPPDQAQLRMDALKQEYSDMKFGWRGGTRNGDAIYYSIQGPTLLIEYAAQDAQANHIHTIYRDPTNAYGKQLEGE